jgi:hypothetical protein
MPPKPRFQEESFTSATGRKLSEEQIQEFKQIQLQANRRTHIGSGMNHPNFLATVEYLDPEWKEKLEKLAPRFAKTKNYNDKPISVGGPIRFANYLAYGLVFGQIFSFLKN